MIDKGDDSRAGLLGRAFHIISSGLEGREYMTRFMEEHKLKELGAIRDLDLVFLEIFVSEWEWLELEESLGDPEFSATPPPITEYVNIDELGPLDGPEAWQP